MKTNNSKFPDQNGFKVPENYFQELDDRIMARLNSAHEEELPLAGSGFIVPDNYFENLEDKILAKSITRGKVIKLFKAEYLYYAAAIAAIVVLLSGNFFKIDAKQAIGWDDVEISDIEDYINEGYEMGYIDLNSAEFSEYIFEDGQLVDDSDFEEVNTQAALDYIEENVDDPTYILE